MAGVDLVGVEIVKNRPTSNGEPWGCRAPPGLEVESNVVAGQFLGEKSVPQSTIDCKEEKSPERQTWIHPTKNQNSPQIDQNAKKHEKRQNDVIFTLWDVQKSSSSKI